MDVRPTDIKGTDQSGGLVEAISLVALPKTRKRRVDALRIIASLTLIVDGLLVFLAGQVAHWLTHTLAGSAVEDLLLVAIVTSTMFVRGHYDLVQRSDSTEYGRVLEVVNLAVLVDLIALQLLHWQNLSVEAIIYLWVAMLGLIGLGRFVLRRVRFSLMHKPELRQRTLIVGVTDEARSIVRQWAALPSSTVEPVGFLEDSAPEKLDSIEGLPLLGGSSNIDSIVADYGIDSVLIANPELIHNQLVNSDTIMRTLSQVEVYSTTGIADLFTSTAYVREEAFVPLVVLSKRRMGGVHLVAKTILDYIGTILFLAFAIWPMMIIGLLVRLSSAGPVIYRHKCIGLNDRPFYMLKFRTMYNDGNDRLTPEQRKELREEMKLKDDPRVTPIGKFLRKTSLDELPQLFNVLLGDMSWVGPRPIVEHEGEKFGKYRNIRSTVKPGLTGLWQVSGRKELTYEERAALDVSYVRNHTIWLDLNILLRTIPALLASRGAY